MPPAFRLGGEVNDPNTGPEGRVNDPTQGAIRPIFKRVTRKIFRLDPEDLLRRVREIFTRLVNRDPHYIAAVREASMTVVPSEMNCRTNVLAVAVPVASVPVVLKPVPKVIV